MYSIKNSKNIIINGGFEIWKRGRQIIDTKPCVYHEKTMLQKTLDRLSDETLEKLRFPCHICLVNAACTQHCIEVFRYMNYIANSLTKMTADEIYIYRRTVPNNIRKKIERLVKYNARLVYPSL